MKASFLICALHVCTSIHTALSFHLHLSSPIANNKGNRKGTSLAANEKEDYLPEVSFGAEVVPDGQRPVNEYLDMRQAPLFNWGSNEVGGSGVSFQIFCISGTCGFRTNNLNSAIPSNQLLLRLAVLYAGAFALV